MLAELLAGRKDVEAALAVYDKVRRDRGRWLVESSRRIADVYEWLSELGDDMSGIESEINMRNGVIADVDVREMCRVATQELERCL